MNRKYKILFWVALTILVISNIFWFYQTIDNAVGKGYYKVSCDEYYNDMIEFKKILQTQKTKNEIVDFLERYHVKYDSIQKGTDFIITLNSFSITFDKKGNQKLIEEN